MGPEQHWYLIAGTSQGVAGFPVALSVEREPDLEWMAVHVLCWFVGIARKRLLAMGAPA